MKVAGIVVVYNPDIIKLSECIEKLSRQVQIVYVINNSEIGLSLPIKIENVQLFNLKQNYGIAYALNFGVKLAKCFGYDWVVTMDQDSVLPDKYILSVKELLDKLSRDERIGIIGPLYEEVFEKKTEVFDYSDVEILITSGSFMNVDACINVGGFKDFLFIDKVDHEICMNLRKNGYRVLQLKNCLLEHSLGESSKQIKLLGFYICTLTEHKPFRVYYITRNTLWLCKTYKDVFPNECKRYLRKLYCYILKILLFESEKLNKINAFIQGIKDYKAKKFGKLI